MKTSRFGYKAKPARDQPATHYFQALRWFRLQIAIYHHQDTTRLSHPNLIANCFTGKSISRQWCIFSPENF